MPGSIGGASSVSSFSGKDGSVNNFNMRPGEDDLFDETKAVTTGVFGVLYTVCKEQVVSWKFAFARLFLEWMQLFLLTVNPAFGFHINSHSITWEIFNFVQLSDFMKTRGYTFFLVCLYMMVAGLITSAVLSVWVAWSFQNNRFDHTWPIAFLRWFSRTFFQTLNIFTLSLFLITLDCQYFDRPKELLNHSQEFPKIMCWTMPHLIHVMISVLALIIFIVMASAFSMAELELNLLIRKNPLAMAHSKVEAIGFLIKIVMTTSTVFVNNNKWLSGVMVICSWILTWLYTNWVPHYNATVNLMRTGSYASIFFSSIMMALVVWTPGVSKSDIQARLNYRETVTYVTYGGVPVAMALGALAGWLRLRYFNKSVLPRFNAPNPSGHPADVYEFSDPREVEILARCCRKWVAREVLDKSAVALATTVMKNGMAQLQKSPYMIILYASFLIEVQTSYQSGYKVLQSAKKCDPSLLERFAIFAREQQHTQKAAGAPGEATDLVSYVEFQRNYGLAMKVHKEALLSIRAFWQALLHSVISFDGLTKAVGAMDANIHQAERVYRSVLQRHANNARMVRLYAKFLEHVKHDPWAASKWFIEADRLREIEETSRTSAGVFVGGEADPGLQEALMSDSEERAIIIANAMGLIQMANPTAHELFRFGRGELRNKNIALLMPPTVAEKHATYVRNYIVTGRERPMHHWNELVAVAKDKSMVSVRLQVAKLSGIGEDSVFVAMFEPIQPTENKACLWVGHTGQVLAVDSNFSDWLGFRAADMVGSSLWSVVADREELDTALKSARTVAARQQKGSSTGHHARGSIMLSAPPMIASPTTPKPGQRVSASGAAPVSANGGHGAPAAGGGPLQTTGTLGGLLGGDPKKERRVSTRMQDSEGNGISDVKSMLSQRWAHHPTMQDMHSWEVAEVEFRHRFVDSLEMGVTVSNGGIGGYNFQKLTLHRPMDRTVPSTPMSSSPVGSHLDGDSHMMVMNKGKLCHVTSSLASMLGADLRSLLSNGGQNGLESLLPEPFATLHTNSLVTAPVLPPAKSQPPYSCRSGFSVLLASTSQQTTNAVPFRLGFSKQVQGDDTFNVVTLRKVPLEEALAERRVSLILNSSGEVQRVTGGVGNNGVHLFGFDPTALVGRSVASFIDVFRSVNEADDEADAAEDQKHGGVSRLLASLAARVLQRPGASWCVGVCPPVEAGELEALGGLADNIVASLTKAAVMTVKVSLPKFESLSNPARRKLPGVGQTSMRVQGAQQQHPGAGVKFASDHADAQRGVRAAAAQPLAPEDEYSAIFPAAEYAVPDPAAAAVGSTLGTEDPAAPPTTGADAPRGGGAGDWGASGSPEFPSVFATSTQEQPAGTSAMAGMNGVADGAARRGTRQAGGLLGDVEIEIQLWRSDLITSVFEVDNNGRIVAGSDVPPAMATLCPPGLLLSASAQSMTGMSLAHYVPPLQQKSVADLMLEAGADGAEEDVPTKRGGMKNKITKLDRSNARRVSPVHTFTVPHRGDGQDMQISLQMVSKSALGSGYWVVVHAAAPRFGRQDLLTWMAAKASGASSRRGGVARQHSRGVHRQVSRQISRLSLVSGGTAETSARARTGGQLATVASNVSLLESALSGERSVGRHPRDTAALNRHSDNGAAVDTAKGWLPGQVTAASGAAAPGSSEEDGAKAPVAKGVRFGSEHDSTDEDDEQPDRSQRPSPLKNGLMNNIAAAPNNPVSMWVLSSGATFHNTPAGEQPSNAPHVANGDAQAAEKTTVMAFADEETATSNRAVVVAKGDDGPDKEQYASERPSASSASETGDEDAEGAGTAGIAAMMADNQSQTSSGNDAPGGGDHDEGDYRRGKRFRKLLRLMTSNMAQRDVNRYRVQALIIVFVLAAVQIGMFVIMNILVHNQISILTNMRNIGLAASAASEVAITSRNFNMIYWNLTYDTLRFVNDPVNDMAPLKALYRKQIDEFSRLHTGAYLGYGKIQKQLPEQGGVRHLWEIPTLPETIFYTIAFDESLSNFTTMSINTKARTTSLWDAGIQLIVKANNIWENSDWWLEYYKMDFFNNPDLNYIVTNYAQAIIRGYLDTLDGLVTYVVYSASLVNRAQIIILVLEGLVLCITAVVYVWKLSSQVAGFRVGVYHIFLLVPQGLVRALATAQLNLEEEDGAGSDQEDEPALQAVTAAKGTGNNDDGSDNEHEGGGKKSGKSRSNTAHKDGGGGALGMIKLHVGSHSALAQGASLSHTWSSRAAYILRRILRAFAFWKQNTIMPLGGKGKRRLTTSIRSSVWLVWPFLLWGTVIIIVNGVGYKMLGAIAGPVSTYIILNFVTVMYQRNIFTLQELVFEPALERMDYWRNLTKKQIDQMRREYNVLLLGRKAAANETSAHYVGVKQGIISSPGRISDLLFSTKECLCVDQTQCWPPGSKYHEYTHHGLDKMVQRYLELGDTIKDYVYLDPYMNGEMYGYYWNTKPDMSGGFAQLNELYHESVVNVYTSVLNLHIVGLALTLSILVCYLVLIMRPFMSEVANETRRVAELLSQLPNEVDVEGVLTRILLQAPPSGSSVRGLPKGEVSAPSSASLKRPPIM